MNNLIETPKWSSDRKGGTEWECNGLKFKAPDVMPVPEDTGWKTICRVKFEDPSILPWEDMDTLAHQNRSGYNCYALGPYYGVADGYVACGYGKTTIPLALANCLQLKADGKLHIDGLARTPKSLKVMIYESDKIWETDLRTLCKS